VTAPDPHTLAITWRTTYAFADRLQRGELNPLPRHLLADSYASALDQFPNLPYWTTDYVGLGPFQFAGWTPGVQLDLMAFERYWGGRPELDTITVRFILDPNAMVANLLSGEVDVASAGTHQQALLLKEEFLRSGKGTVIFYPNGNWRFLGPYALDAQRPYLRDAHFRAGLYHAIDKRDLAEAEYQGAGVTADAWVAPTDPQWSIVRDAVRIFDYSPERARQLFAEAGWQRGADGVLTNARGERASMALHGLGSITPYIVDFWQRVGLPTQEVVTPPQLARDPEWLATRGGVEVSARTIDPEMMKSRFHSSAIPLAERRFVGANRQGYGTPVVDELIERYAVTLREAERWQLEREVIRHVLGDAAIGPLFFTQSAMAVATGVSGIRPLQVGGGRFTVSWNAREWRVR
jgi:peptide/nickel transport system substrate-binding protein